MAQQLHSTARYSTGGRLDHPVRVAILDTDSVPVSLADKYGAFWSAAFVARLGSAIQNTNSQTRVEFSTFDVVNGHYPDPSAVDAIMLTGGKSSAYWPDAWMGKLLDFVASVYRDYPHVKLVGICLGHQVIAHALLKEHGGFAEKNPKGLQMGIRSINLDPEFYNSFPNMKPDLKTLRMHVIHGDHVYCPPGKLPPGWVSIGRSDCCEIHGLYQSGRVFSIQSHFEFTRALCYDIIEYLALADGKPSNAETIDALLGDAKDVDDGEVVAGMIISFLTHETPSARPPIAKL